MTKGFLCGVLASVAFAASAAETVVTEDRTAGGDWEVSVAAGDTTIVTAAQTGSGKIVKKGAGALILAGGNTFAGGLVVDEGSVEPHHSDAFGVGKITLNADGVKECRVAFTKGQLTFTNDLELVGTSAIDKPAFYFHSATNVWNGRITASTGDFYMCDNGDWCYISTGGKYENGVFSGGSWSTKVSKIQFMTFNGEINVHGILYLVPDGHMTFNGRIVCDTLHTCYRTGLYTLHGANDSSFYATIDFNGALQVRQFNAAYAARSFAAGVIDGAIIHWPGIVNHSEGPGAVNFSAPIPNRVAGFTSVFPRQYLNSGYGNIQGASKAGVSSPKIVATGLGATGDEPTFACHSALGPYNGYNRYFDFAVDGTGVNPGFVQIFSNRHHTVQGMLAATNGTLRFVGVSSCSNVTALVIGANGRIEDLTTYQGSFPKVTKIAVAATGKLKLGNYSIPETFATAQPALELEAGAIVEAPVREDEVFVVTSLTIGGVPRQVGTYAATELAGVTLPAGLQIKVTQPVPAAATAVWTGADAADNRMTTLGNWRDAAALPDLTSGLTKVTLADGEAMIPGEGCSYLHSIESEIESADDAAPFVLGEPGGKIEVVGAIKSVKKRQLIVRGTIAPPVEAGDQGAPTANGDRTFYHWTVSHRNGTWPSAYIPGEYKYSAPLVLDGATIAKPYYSSVDGGGAGACHLRTMADTMNRLTGGVYLYNSGWSELSVAKGSTLEFAGGVNCGARIVMFGAGTLLISGKPWSGTSGLTMEGGAGRIVLDVEDNWFGNCSVGYGLDLKSGGGTIEFRRSNCLAEGHQMAIRNNSKCVVELNCTTQRVAQLSAASSHKESVIHGDYGAMLEITGGCRTPSMTEGFAGMICSMQITGGVGVHMTGTGKGNNSGTVKDGADDMYMLRDQDFQSCGNLEVSGGKLSLVLGASWKNGTNFIMRGTGQLRLAGQDQLSYDNARLHFSEEGNLYLGGMQHVKSAEVLVGDVWTEVPPGWYDVNSKGLLANRISGSGRLRVGVKGCMLLIK
ncbi:MAG: autotransporter-associated beta strand repeat-containing protein [Kiritimatiellae bacterium]|nr:autotransporter-associated beta strand repeat-containing protein [Kiritimatiellia bacterium]